MILNGKEKVQVLLKLLGNHSQKILELVNPEKAQILRLNVENAPLISITEINQLLDEIILKSHSVLNPENITESVKSENISATAVSKEKKETENITSELPKNENKPISINYNFNKIAELLLKEKPQTIAFVFSKLSEEEKNNLIPFLPENIINDLTKLDVENIPLADKIYQVLYQKIFQNQN